MSFFSMFPYRSFDLQDNGVTRVITDIFRNVDVNDALLDNVAAYRSYYVNDGERPDVVSDKIYGSTEYYWTFFVTNDFLKEGLNTWPMSNLELEKFITREYGNYSILSFVPLAIANKTYTPEGEGAQTITYTHSFNTFSNLPLDPQYLPYLNLVAYGSSGSSISASKIVRFDSSTLQLWIERNSNSAFYTPTSGFKYTLEFINALDVEDADYATVEALKLEWNEKILAGLETTDPPLYYTFKDSGFYPKLEFIASDIWQDSYNAAYGFYKQESDASFRSVTYYDLMLDQIATLNNQYSFASLKNTNSNYVSYIQNEYNINEMHRNITVVKQSYIVEFAESFKTAINLNV